MGNGNLRDPPEVLQSGSSDGYRNCSPQPVMLEVPPLLQYDRLNGTDLFLSLPGGQALSQHVPTRDAASLTKLSKDFARCRSVSHDSKIGLSFIKVVEQSAKRNAGIHLVRASATHPVKSRPFGI